jgi:hypothetical protein
MTIGRQMNMPFFSLQEDLFALSELQLTVAAEKQLSFYLQTIETAPSRAHLDKRLDQASGYLQALADFSLLNEQQSILLRELVTRASMRSLLS